MSESEESDGDFDPREFEVAAQDMQDNEDLQATLREQRRQKNANVDNIPGLQAKLTEFQLPATWGWVEKLQLSTQTPLEVTNPDDDLAREAEFYQRSLLAVKQGLVQFDQSKLPWRVPPDYYAERVKPDSQMQKIKDSLMAESRRMNIVAERKKVKALKKNAKQLRASQQEERAKAKKAFTSGINALTSRGGKHNELKVARSEHVDIESAVNGLIEGRGFRDDNSKKRKRDGKQDDKAQKSKRRLAMDKKYGHGGGRTKKNSFESAADMSGWSTKKNRALPSGMSKGGGKGKGGRGGTRGGRGGRGGGRRGSSRGRK